MVGFQTCGSSGALQRGGWSSWKGKEPYPDLALEKTTVIVNRRTAVFVTRTKHVMARARDPIRPPTITPHYKIW